MNSTPLFRAASDGDVKSVRALLENDVNVDSLSYGNETALMAACEYGHHLVAKILIEAGADINISSSSGWTPLIHTAMGGHVKVAELLIANGANPLHVDMNGRNATDHARQKYDPILAQGYRNLGIPDIYVSENNLSVDWKPKLKYDVFVSYKHLNFTEDADKLKQSFEEINKSVFVDRHELALDSESLNEAGEIKAKLKMALNVSSLTIFFEIYWGRDGDLPIDPDRLDWQFFELLHSNRAILVSVERKECRKLIIKPGELLQSEYAFEYTDYSDLAEKIASSNYLLN